MLVYHAVFFICSALVLISGQRRDAIFTLCFTFSFFLILFLVGFRYASTDYFTYWRIFDYIESFSNLGFFLYTPETGQKPHETLFSAIILLTKSIGF